MELNPAIAHLAPLVGTWRGKGHGEYPTINDFDYDDEFTFSHAGKPFLAFVERTWNASGTPMHTESGYLRGTGPNAVELVVAIPTGQTELGTGTSEVEDGTLIIMTDAGVQNTPKAKQVDRIVRRFEVNGDRLTYEMHMEAVGEGLALHLRAELVRA